MRTYATWQEMTIISTLQPSILLHFDRLGGEKNNDKKSNNNLPYEYPNKKGYFLMG